MGFVHLMWPFWNLLHTIKTYSHTNWNVQIPFMTFILAENDVFGSNVHFCHRYTCSGVPKKSVHLNKCTELIGVKGNCPLYTKMLDIAKALHTYPSKVMQNLPKHAKSFILWIIHLQACHFAQEEKINI